MTEPSTPVKPEHQAQDPSPTQPSSQQDTGSHEEGQVEEACNFAEFLAPPQADDELGRLAQYRILKVLGHGGMGMVLLAEDPQL